MISEILEILLAILAFSVLVFFVWRGFNSSLKNSRAWRELALRTQLNYTPKKKGGGGYSTERLDGSYHGRKMALSRIREERSDSDYADKYIKVWAHVTLPTSVRLLISPKTPIEKLAFFEGSQGITIGDEALDKRFNVSGSPGLASRVFASAHLRRRLQEGPTPAIEISSVKAGVESRISIAPRGANYWQSVIDLLCDVADAIEESALPD